MSNMECTSNTKSNTTELEPKEPIKTGIIDKQLDAAKPKTLENTILHDSTSSYKTVPEGEAHVKPNKPKAAINPKATVDYLPNFMQTCLVKKTSLCLTPIEQSLTVFEEAHVSDIASTLGASSYIRPVQVKERIQNNETISCLQNIQSVEPSEVDTVAAVCEFEKALPISVNKTEEKTSSAENEQSAAIPHTSLGQQVDLTPSLAQQRNVKTSPQVMIHNQPMGSDIPNVQIQNPTIDTMQRQNDISIDAVPSEPRSQIIDVSQAEFVQKSFMDYVRQSETNTDDVTICKENSSSVNENKCVYQANVQCGDQNSMIVFVPKEKKCDVYAKQIGNDNKTINVTVTIHSSTVTFCGENFKCIPINANGEVWVRIKRMSTVYERQTNEIKDVDNSMLIENIVQEDLLSVRLQRSKDKEFSLENILHHRAIEEFMSKPYCTYQVTVHDFDYDKQLGRVSVDTREQEEEVFNDGPLYRSLYSTIQDEHVLASSGPPKLPPRPPPPTEMPSTLRKNRLVYSKSESDMPEERIRSAPVQTPPRPKQWPRCHHGKMEFAEIEGKLKFKKEGSFLLYTSQRFEQSLAFIDSNKAVKTLDIVRDSKGYYLKHKPKISIEQMF
ncbi:uncharacterized protein LOC127859065 isoform X2 [Dreissena polymorpha]|uniref:uncharacterized protein LOC127859065 isoform X2 n=1 Tax=Dreissena polymorpha TaxID=45954 RepID=UPI002264739E|nr:uncharacterized protein LOC127859065 isoform X2 [Dreissena polymorpha]